MLPASPLPPRTLVVSSLSISWTSRPALSAIAPPPAWAVSVVTAPRCTAEGLADLEPDRAGIACACAAGRDDPPVAELEVRGRDMQIHRPAHAPRYY